MEGYKAKAYRTLLQSLASFEAANNNEMREKAKSRQHRERIRTIKKEEWYINTGIADSLLQRKQSSKPTDTGTCSRDGVSGFPWIQSHLYINQYSRFLYEVTETTNTYMQQSGFSLSVNMWPIFLFKKNYFTHSHKITVCMYEGKALGS